MTADEPLVTLTVSRTDQLTLLAVDISQESHDTELLANARRFTEGDRKKENADRECNNQNVSNAFHTKISRLFAKGSL